MHLRGGYRRSRDGKSARRLMMNCASAMTCTSRFYITPRAARSRASRIREAAVGSLMSIVGGGLPNATFTLGYRRIV